MDELYQMGQFFATLVRDILYRMQKRLITGVVLVLLTLAVQDRFFVAPTKTVPSSNVGRLTTAPIGQSYVSRVIDGDTIVVDIGGVPEKVRLIGVDTPETVDPRKPVQCFGKEASAFTKSLLLNTSVKLESDASQGERDKYGRVLRYVFLEDGTLVNKKIISEGYGHEYTYRLPYQYQKEFKTAERSARESGKGLWAQGVCGA